ncbi:MAG: hypothetical protein H0W64_09405 [Gammaproteobacteria bacterium]|nr:hypothetical protein [Gammaproteobacteria bacterium]
MYTITRQALIDLYQNQKEGLKNLNLRSLGAANFFEAGAGGFQQFKYDYYDRNFQCKGKVKLDLGERNDHSPEEIKQKLSELFGETNVDKIIAAHSQGPTAFVSFTLNFGLASNAQIDEVTKEKDNTQQIQEAQFSIKQDTQVVSNLDINEKGEIILSCKSKGFELISRETAKTIEYFSAPVNSYYQLKEIKGVWGYELIKIETNHELISRIFRDELVSEEDILNDIKQVKDKKQCEEVFGSPVMINSAPRYDNSDPQVQFNRDFEMISRAIEKPGNLTAAITLKRIFALLYYGELYYKRKNEWHLWQNNQQNMPIVASICHGARVLVQFPSQLSNEIISWLQLKGYERAFATHGIQLAAQAEKVGDENKILAEQKRKHYETLYDASSFGQWQHYGINVALGGENNIHPFSHKIIQSNGEHGHLYLCHASELKAQDNNNASGGLLIGLEQSAPGYSDQVGGAHSIRATRGVFTATGGDHFANPLRDVSSDYVGLAEYGPDEYYDGLFLQLTPEKFNAIKKLADSFSLNLLLKPGESLKNKETIATEFVDKNISNQNDFTVKIHPETQSENNIQNEFPEIPSPEITDFMSKFDKKKMQLSDAITNPTIENPVEEERDSESFAQSHPVKGNLPEHHFLFPEISDNDKKDSPAMPSTANIVSEIQNNSNSPEAVLPDNVLRNNNNNNVDSQKSDSYESSAPFSSLVIEDELSIDDQVSPSNNEIFSLPNEPKSIKQIFTEGFKITFGHKKVEPLTLNINTENHEILSSYILPLIGWPRKNNLLEHIEFLPLLIPRVIKNLGKIVTEYLFYVLKELCWTTGERSVKKFNDPAVSSLGKIGYGLVALTAGVAGFGIFTTAWLVARATFSPISSCKASYTYGKSLDAKYGSYIGGLFAAASILTSLSAFAVVSIFAAPYILVSVIGKLPVVGIKTVSLCGAGFAKLSGFATPLAQSMHLSGSVISTAIVGAGVGALTTIRGLLAQLSNHAAQATYKQEKTQDSSYQANVDLLPPKSLRTKSLDLLMGEPHISERNEPLVISESNSPSIVNGTTAKEEHADYSVVRTTCSNKI